MALSSQMLLVVLLSFSYFTSQCRSNDVLGCGGYIKSEVEMNFSQVHLKLLTQQGNLKYETECAPNNGYYFIPLYDKGQYILKVSPPVGWSFEPEEVHLKVDGETDPCSINQDINFMFKGFAIVGRVITSGSDIGPSGVTVSLQKGQKELRSTVSGENGDYLFSPLAVGSYELVASHPKWKLLQEKVSVELLNSNGDGGNGLVVAGYTLSGSIGAGFEPLIDNIKVVLHSSNKDIKSQLDCSRTKPSGYASLVKQPILCHTTLSKNGKFQFSSLPFGKYIVVPWIDSTIQYDLSPPILHIEIGHRDYEITEPVKILGRDFLGKILPAESATSGIPGAEVSLGNELKISTDENGDFIFPKLGYGQYRLRASADGYEFEEHSFSLQSTSVERNSLAPSKYRVCFTVSVDSTTEIDIPWIINVRGSNVDESIQTNASGSTCIFLPHGEYVSSVVLSPQDKEAGIIFGPEELAFNVESSPISSLTFSQFLAEIHGTVQCLESCKSLTISLQPSKGTSGSSRVTTTVQEKFSFQDVVPGDYLLTVDKEEWCWKNQTLHVLVNKKSITIKFVQTGFRLTLNSSHRTTLNYVTNHGLNGKLNVLEGTSRECVSAPGKYAFTPTGCHQYMGSHLAWDTASPQLISLIPSHHLINGTVLSSEPGPFTVTVKFNRKSIKVLGPLQPSSTDKNAYIFQVFIEVGDSATFTPSSSSNLFQYTPIDFSVREIGNCVLNAVTFEAERALFFKGYIKPAIKGVSINVMTDEEKEFSFTTNAEGFFIAGPLNKSMNYTVKAEKLGYIITPPFHRVDSTDKRNYSDIVKLYFEAYKLAEIIVNVLDESNQPLEGVLVSTSGGMDYRQNSLTEGDGVFTFRSLMPSDYFIRPMMKEYVFEPASKMVHVEAGATVSVTIRGKRIAYSILGKTVSLNGDVETDVVIEAVGVGPSKCEGLQEEGSSDSDGQFRIRGLVPHCDYKLRLKEGDGLNEHVERTLPAEALVHVGDTDLQYVSIIVLRPFLQMDILVTIDTEPQYLSSLSAEIYSDDNQDSPVHVVNLDSLPFFMLPPMIMDKKTYTIQMRSNLLREHYSFSSPAISFVADKSFIRKNLTFKPTLRNADAEISRSTIFGLLTFFLMIAIAFHYEKLQPIALQVFKEASEALKNTKTPGFAAQLTTSSYSLSETVRKRSKSRKT